MHNEPFICPLGMKLKDRRVVFAGAGAVAERRLLRLVNSGARLHVIAPAATTEIRNLAAAGRITLQLRKAEPADFERAFLAFIATDDEAASAELANSARKQGALVNRADAPDDCDFVLPAQAWMNTVNIGVFSGSPALSKWVRQHLEKTLGPEFPEFAGAFAQIRQKVRRLPVPQTVRAEILTRLLNEGIYDLYRLRGMQAALGRVDELIKTYRESEPTQS